ncbi:SAM-dependent methyltransferase [Nocardioides albus]|uniref:Cyclopropane-fatty-acyl-phospholipid synthase n=1 Tax=Nocardioides albus TaxID=1841 RepID=A0A7W5F832_9ACTN|nr:cyclopropane-fatty-acyl-phospholipid synthase family protein [Nocardioides albus]MBB3088631.1 cyclopropane-fatty-acyl-phospholipid synthase [Nocardioides albus]GGU17586.1 cyclopropane-fatty-acyl-phospholipid synthase [Nocardioides albus]
MSAEPTTLDRPVHRAPMPTRSLKPGVAKQILRLATRRVPVDVALPDGSLLNRRGGSPAAGRPGIVLRRPESLYSRVAANPKIGIGEAYTAGDWDAADGTDLADALTPYAERLSGLLPAWMLRLRGLVDQPIPADQRGAVEDTQENISAHYDLGNDMFAAFLDPSLSYSSAMFDRTRPVVVQDLQEAQLRKVDAVLDLAGVGVGDDLLEIGTGWGTLAIEAARRGAQVTTVTLSVEQAAMARKRVEEAGFTDRVEVLVQDYRHVVGTFDAVVSVEMIEAVGERYWPQYFATLSRLVRPGGAIALQSILMPHQRYLATRRSYGWIQKHIFPGGLIPSATAISEHAGRVGLAVTRTDTFGADYAETLRRWRSAFLAAWPTIRSDTFGEEFRRTWEFYLAYCEAGFRAGVLDVAQIRLEADRRNMP